MSRNCKLPETRKLTVAQVDTRCQSDFTLNRRGVSLGEVRIPAGSADARQSVRTNSVLKMTITELHKPRSIAWNTPAGRPWNKRITEHARRKPDGGFCFVPAMALLRAWWAYKREIIRLYDLRVWFACFEVVARRCDVAPNRFPRYTMEEIHRLVGGANPDNVQTAVGRLTKAGLLAWAERKLEFPGPESDVDSGLDPEFDRVVGLVTNHRRKVPVPRRTLRFLSGISRPVFIATALGHLLRCVYYRNGLCVPDGRCKASWVAETFGVDVRNVKAARRQLNDIGWLVVGDSSQTALNRWGAAVRINLNWKDKRDCDGSGSPPPARSNRRQSPPPRINRELSSRMIHQKPAAAGRPGACALPMPSLRKVRLEDLSDARRLDVLFTQACRLRLVACGEAAQLRFHAAAAHALRLGKQNPAGLFAAIVRRGLWSFLSVADEDQARHRLASASHTPTVLGHRNAAGAKCSIRPTSARVVLESVLSRLRPANASAI